MSKIRLEAILLLLENSDIKKTIRQINNDPELLAEINKISCVVADKTIPRSTSQALYHIKNNHNHIPTCICGKNRVFKDYMNGYNHSCGNKECRYEIKKNTCIERYGVEHALQNIEIKNRMISTNNLKYGKDFTWQSDEIKKTIKNKMIANHGVSSYLEKPEIRKLGIKSLVEKNNNLYGVNHIMQTVHYFDIIKKAGYKLKPYILPSGKIVNIQGYENLAIDELLKLYNESDIIIENTDIQTEIGKIMWIDDNEKLHRYFPDIYIKSENTIYEVKSEWSFLVDHEINIKKKDACIENGLLFKFMIYDKNYKIWRYVS